MPGTDPIERIKLDLIAKLLEVVGEGVWEGTTNELAPLVGFGTAEFPDGPLLGSYLNLVLPVAKSRHGLYHQKWKGRKSASGVRPTHWKLWIPDDL